jgi:hypothetical protein
LLHVALQIASDEALTQSKAVLVRCSQKAVRKSSAQPQALLCSVPSADLEGIERPHVDVLDAASQRLARLTQQIDGGRAQQQEKTSALSFAPRTVDHAAKCLEDLRRAVNLVQDDELIGMLREVQLRVG